MATFTPSPISTPPPGELETRDEDFTRDFLTRHQNKLLYGSDCSDHEGAGPKCQGAQTIAVLQRLAASRAIERKLLFENANRLFRLPK